MVVGLGNPGEKYKNTRHNAGFLFLEYITPLLSEKCEVEINWEYSSRFKASIAEFKYKKKKFALIRPYTYMNESGWSTSQYMAWNKISPENLIVVHDDLDIRLGKFKFSPEKGPKVHYGIVSIENYLKTKEFLRLRIGVDNREQSNQKPGVAYLMEVFSPEEQKMLQDVFEQATPEFMLKLLGTLQTN